ncbi:hypothetical protein F5Y14DRAFT_421632 [Nemania sp. NC0429]|nr:hypothetical protein F5Y14DRAFT_421632 [Nemania sp. NC0429]
MYTYSMETTFFRLVYTFTVLLFLLCPMRIPRLSLRSRPGSATFRARYTDRDALEEQLSRLFPARSIRITYERGHFKCIMPRPLTPEEHHAIELAIATDHH